MRVKITGDSDCACALRGYLQRAGDVALTKEGDGIRPDFEVIVEESRTGRFYFDSVDCELERHLFRRVRDLSEKPIAFETAGGIRRDDTVRIVFPPSEARAVELGVQMGFADMAAPRFVAPQAPAPPAAPAPIPAAPAGAERSSSATIASRRAWWRFRS